MRFTSIKSPLVAAVGMCILTLPVYAKISEEEADRLGKDLTPVGAIMAGNSDGSIPAWDGGLTPDKLPPELRTAEWPENPWPEETPLLVITKDNYKQYADQLTVGQMKLFENYPDTWKMNIYPTHRTWFAPQHVYEATKRAAVSVEQCGPRCITGVVEGGGYPFPIPKTGLEVLYNNLYKYEIPTLKLYNATKYITDSAGGFTRIKENNWYGRPYWMPKADGPNDSFFTDRNGGAYVCINIDTIAPPRNAGIILSACWNHGIQTAEFYGYFPGQRRVRRLPAQGNYDEPAANADGLRTSDQNWGFFPSGTEERYEYKIRGVEERFVSYNNYIAADKTIGLDEVLGTYHVNPEYLRYELHRVWVIDVKLLPGKKHLIASRTAYVDEDTWIPVVNDMYDGKGEIWRYGEYGHVFDYRPSIQSNVLWADQQIDFKTPGRYTGNAGWFNDQTPTAPEAVNPSEMNWEMFTPSGLRQMGRR